MAPQLSRNLPQLHLTLPDCNPPPPHDEACALKSWAGHTQGLGTGGKARRGAVHVPVPSASSPRPFYCEP